MSQVISQVPKDEIVLGILRALDNKLVVNELKEELFKFIDFKVGHI